MLRIYMFHYVTENFNYYHFDKNRFENVIKQLSATKKIISLKKLKEMQDSGHKFDDDYVMLTFDDGTIDHYKYVYPILKKYNVTGLFFICSNVVNGDILDIQFIHQLLSKVSIDEIYYETQKYIVDNKINVELGNIISNNKFGNWKEVCIKQLIQTFLPQKDSKKLLEKLIKKYDVSTNFSDYYMSLNNIFEMKKNNMEFGCHTVTHKRLAFLTREEQNREIKENMQLLFEKNILTKQDVLSIAYPFGNYNSITKGILDDLNFDFGFSTKEDGIYEINKYEMSRLDCKGL